MKHNKLKNVAVFLYSAYPKLISKFPIRNLFLFMTICFALLVAPIAHAALVDNGNGLIYDTDLNITWYDAPAVARNWTDAVAWAANLSVTDVNGNIITGWRLPSTVNGSAQWGYDGTTTTGFNVSFR